MNYSWKIVRTIMAVVGGLLIFGAVGTFDYCMELGQRESSSAWTTIIIGAILMLPTLVHVIRVCKEDVQN